MRLSGKVFAACGVWMALLGAYFICLRPALLPEDPRFMGTSIEALHMAAPGLARWLGHVFDVMGGFMIAAGVLTALVAWRTLPARAPGSLPALIVAGGFSVILMSATNFMLGSDFRWVLLAPALLWLAGLALYVREGTTKSALSL